MGKQLEGSNQKSNSNKKTPLSCEAISAAPSSFQASPSEQDNPPEEEKGVE